MAVFPSGDDARTCISALAAVFLLCSTALAAQDVREHYDVATNEFPFRALYFGHPLAETLYEAQCGELIEEDCPLGSKREFYASLYAVESIRYFFEGEIIECPYLPEICQRGEAWLSFNREISVDISRLIAAIREVISSFGYGGCSFMNVSIGPARAVDPQTLRLDGHYSGRRRFCDNILGTHDIGSATGMIEVSVNLRATEFPRPILLNPDTPETIVGEILLDPSERIYNQRHTFLTIFDLNTLGGRFLAGLLSLPFEPFLALFGQDTAHQSMSNLLSTASSIDPSEAFGTAGDILRRIARYPQDFPEVFPDAGVTIPYLLDPSSTRFEVRNGSVFLVSSYRKAVPELRQFQDAVHNANHVAIRFYNSLGNEERNHRIAAGEALEQIVSDEYGDVLMTYYIASINDIANPNRIQAENEIRLPAIWQIALDIYDRQLIRLGSSHYHALSEFGFFDVEIMETIRNQSLPDYILPYQVPLAIRAHGP